MEDKVLIKEVSSAVFVCRPIPIRTCFVEVLFTKNLLQRLDHPTRLSSYISYLTTLSDALKMSLVGHRDTDRDNMVVVGETIVREHNVGLSRIISLRNAIVHGNELYKIAMSIDLLCIELRDREAYDKPIPKVTKEYVDVFYSVNAFDILNDVYDFAMAYIAASNDCSATTWCRDNAPYAVKGKNVSCTQSYV